MPKSKNRQNAKEPIEIGIIGGSGLYGMTGLSDTREVRVKTPFGDPSDAFITGTLEGSRVAFLARHGRGHRLSPSEINYRANIFAMKLLGAERIISVSAVGSLPDDLPPLALLLHDQFLDRSRPVLLQPPPSHRFILRRRNRRARRLRQAHLYAPLGAPRRRLRARWR